MALVYVFTHGVGMKYDLKYTNLSSIVVTTLLYSIMTF